MDRHEKIILPEGLKPLVLMFVPSVVCRYGTIAELVTIKVVFVIRSVPNMGWNETRFKSVTVERQAKCRLCHKKIERGTRCIGLKDIVANGKWFDLFFHKDCFKDNLENEGLM